MTPGKGRTSRLRQVQLDDAEVVLGHLDAAAVHRDVLMAQLAVAYYLLPTIVAVDRRKARWRRIAAVNVLAGWTIIAWSDAV